MGTVPGMSGNCMRCKNQSMLHRSGLQSSIKGCKMDRKASMAFWGLVSGAHLCNEFALVNVQVRATDTACFNFYLQATLSASG